MLFVSGGLLRGPLPSQRRRAGGQECAVRLWRVWENILQPGQTKAARVHPHGGDTLRVQDTRYWHGRSLHPVSPVGIMWLLNLCAGCDKKFTSKFKLKRHVLIHSQTKTFLCDVCNRAFRRKDHLKNHEKARNYAAEFSRNFNQEKALLGAFSEIVKSSRTFV